MSGGPVWSGPHFSIEYFELPGGSAPASDFLHTLNDSDRAKVSALFARLCDHGRIANEQKFKKLEASDGIFEFKSHKIRLFCFFASKKRVILLDGVLKKQDRHRKADIERVEGYRAMFLSRER